MKYLLGLIVVLGAVITLLALVLGALSPNPWWAGVPFDAGLGVAVLFVLFLLMGVILVASENIRNDLSDLCLIRIELRRIQEDLRVIRESRQKTYLGK